MRQGSKHKAVIPVLENCSAVLSAVGSSVRFASMESSKNSELKEMYDDKWTSDVTQSPAMPFA